jgi:hypothetical protein
MAILFNCIFSQFFLIFIFSASFFPYSKHVFQFKYKEYSAIKDNNKENKYYVKHIFVAAMLRIASRMTQSRGLSIAVCHLQTLKLIACMCTAFVRS